MPGMLDGRRRTDDGLRAGLTSSPDFLRTMPGREERSSSSSSSSLLSTELGCFSGEVDCFMPGPKMVDSVEDLECEILRAEGVRGGVTGADADCWSAACDDDGMDRPRASLAFLDSLSTRLGELSRCCSMMRMAACSSARFSNSRPRCSLGRSSSSLECCMCSSAPAKAPALFDGFLTSADRGVELDACWRSASAFARPLLLHTT